MYSKNTLLWSMRQVWFDEKQFPSFFVTSSSTLYFFQDTSIDRKKLWPNRGIFRLQQPQWSIGRDPKELPEATHKVYLCTQLTQGKWILWDLSLRTHKSFSFQRSWGSLSELLWYQTPSFRCHWRERSNSFNFFWTPRLLPLKIGVLKCTKLVLICKEHF